jgi:hypothetical protein
VQHSSWRITPWGVVSTLVLLAFDATPLLALLFGGFSLNWLVLAGFLALSFWLPTVPVVKQAFRDRQLPRITGGPGVSWAGKTYGPGYRHTPTR